MKKAQQMSGEKKVAADLKRQADAIGKAWPDKALTKGQKATIKKHKPTIWMVIRVWFMVKRIRLVTGWERARSWLILPGARTGDMAKVRWGIQKALFCKRPIPVYRDPAIVNHIKSLSRKDVDRLAIVQATHLRTYLDFYGHNLVNHIAIDGVEMTSAGLRAQKAKGVKGPEEVKP